MVFQKGHKFYKGGEKNWFKKGHKLGMTGKHHTEKSRDKMRLKMKGKVGYWKDKKIPQTAKDKMSLAKIGKYIGEKSPSWKGGWKNKLPHCEKCGKKLANLYAKLCYPCFAKFHKGENHYNWQGGISFEPYSVDWTDILKGAIKERDHHICQLCSSQNDLTCHHIDYDKKNCNPDNLITLCRNCHTKTNYKRDYWIKFFKKQREKN